MLNQPASISRQLGRYLLAAPLVLALSISYSAHAQVVPTPAPAEKPIPQNLGYYLDGQKADKATVEKIDPTSISNIQVLNGGQQQRIFGTAPTDGVVVITTKANASSPAVLTLDKKVAAVVPLVGATPDQTAGMAAVQAYMTKNYPSAKVQLIAPTPKQPGRYYTVFVQDGKRLQLFFDGQGNPVQQ
jgi:hypothetical protein